jgi:hypothetical protein
MSTFASQLHSKHVLTSSNKRAIARQHGVFYAERGGPKASTTLQGPLGIRYRPNEEANATADCLENQFTSHDLCDENHVRRVETIVQVLLASVDDNPLGESKTL